MGEPGTFKSFLAIDIALSVATGRPWQGRTALQGPVLFIAAEGHHAFRDRYHAWHVDRGCDKTSSFRLLAEPLNFRDPDHVGEVIRICREEFPTPPVLIIVDTLAQVFADGEENSSLDMGQFNTSCNRLRDEIGACVLVIHHFGWGPKRPRGHSSFFGALDTVIKVARRPNKSLEIALTCGKMRLAPEFGEIKLRMRSVELGDRGDSSLVVDDEVTPRESPSTAETDGYTRESRLYFNSRRLAERIMELGGSATLAEISRMYDRSPKTAQRYAENAEDRGLVVIKKVRENGTSKIRVYAVRKAA